MEYIKKWCPGRDLNSYGVNHTPLKRARLPVPPPGHSIYSAVFNVHHRLYDHKGLMSIAERM
jgi:hypothetical protein